MAHCTGRIPASFPLPTLQYVLAVPDDAHFEQTVSELPDMLRSMRTRTKLAGQAALAGQSNGGVCGRPGAAAGEGVGRALSW